MKKIISIILTLIMCLSLVSCNVTTPPQSTATATPENNETTLPKNEEKTEEVITFEYPEVIEYGVYTSGTDSIFKQDALVDGTLKRISKINVGGERYSSPIGSVSSKFVNLKKINLFGKEIEFETTYFEQKTSNFSECNNPYVRKSIVVNQYAAHLADQENKKFNMVIDAETGRIMQYIRIYDISGEGNFTMEDAKKKAVEIAESEFGKGALDDYIIWFESTSEDRFSIHYSRKLGDYVTNEADSFRIAFGLDGEVLSYNVNNFGDLEGVLGMLTEENLKKAEETLRGALKEDAKVQEDLKQIYIDTVTGVCYIRFSVNGEGYYINIY